jgi:hypothetical protein
VEVARNKTVEYEQCMCGKRGWDDERDADKALGKAQTKRNRAGDKTGTRRGLKRESRFYYCPIGDMFHLTEQSRRTFDSYAGAPLASLVPAQRVAA